MNSDVRCFPEWPARVCVCVCPSMLVNMSTCGVVMAFSVLALADGQVYGLILEFYKVVR